MVRKRSRRKRSSGEGYIYQLPSKRWRAQICIGRQRLSITKASKLEAREWIREIMIKAGVGMAYEANKTTLSKFLHGWLERKNYSTRSHTYETYESLARMHILPELGNYLLSELNPALLQAFMDRKLKSNLQIRTIQMIQGILYNCLDQAVKLGLILRNPVMMVQRPKLSKQEMTVWEEGEVNRFLLAIQGQRYEHLYALALSTGMRQAELLGLKWQDVDWRNHQIQVRRQAIERKGGGFVFAEPKSRRGTRCIELGEGLINRLHDQITRVDLMRQAAREKWKESDLIFPSLAGTPQEGSYLFKDFKHLIEVNNLRRIRFHDMRHTAATIMLSHRIPPVIVAGILGDSLQVLMATYAHFIPSSQGEAARLMDEVTSIVSIEISHGLPTKKI